MRYKVSIKKSGICGNKNVAWTVSSGDVKSYRDLIVSLTTFFVALRLTIQHTIFSKEKKLITRAPTRHEFVMWVKKLRTWTNSIHSNSSHERKQFKFCVSRVQKRIKNIFNFLILSFWQRDKKNLNY